MNKYLLIMLLTLSGCASVPLAPVEKDNQAKRFVPENGLASLYIYRNENLGGAVSMDVFINGKTIGQTGPQSYFMYNLTPGQYHLESKTENTSVLDLKLESDTNYFVWQEVKMGVISARSKLQLVDEATGKAGVIESKLINSALSNADISHQNTSSPSLTQKLQELKSLFDSGKITKEEYELSKQKALETFK